MINVFIGYDEKEKVAFVICFCDLVVNLFWLLRVWLVAFRAFHDVQQPDPGLTQGLAGE